VEIGAGASFDSRLSLDRGAVATGAGLVSPEISSANFARGRNVGGTESVGVGCSDFGVEVPSVGGTDAISNSLSADFTAALAMFVRGRLISALLAGSDV